jgi:limonene-1,2-epoxide hydrolase
MPDRHERIVRAFCAAWGDGKTRRPDIDKIVSLFAPDGEWQLWVPTGKVIRGQEALRKEVERQCGFSTYMRRGVTKIVAASSTVVTECVDHFTMRGIRVENALMAIYELDGNGKIRSWRQYFDTADLARQLGMQPGDVIDG